VFGSLKRLLTRVLIAPVMLIFCCANAFAADDQQLPTTVAAVIDYQRILLESAASKSIAEQMDIRRKAFQDEIGKEEQRLHEARKALGKQRSILSNEAFETKQGEFEKEYADVRQLASDRRKQLEAASAEAVNEVAEQLGIEMPICHEIYRILYEDADPREAVGALMSRQLRSEN